ncbi:sortase A [Geodermatophilus saharensis]|uniref:Sortase A n=1 Tax=Geodermatophilus saharensis TaxID=1137994 RepID=A0A239BBD4_9ACTN|nr:class E sortase [Geodermatophilus saharensis]SNS04758.1 sortase A [Geodermatophilus saharensis]
MASPSATAPPPTEWRRYGRPRRDRWRTLVSGLGQTLVTAGLVLLLFVVYELYVTDLFAAREQDRLADELRTGWNADAPVVGVPTSPAEPGVGEPFAVLHVPRLGEDWSRVVLEGTTEDQLSQGPGHYVGTAMPGQQGNLAIAGHRVGRGSPFLDLDALRPGDPIVVEVADGWFTYRVLGDEATGDFADPSGIPGQQIVTPADVDVIAPTPGGPADAAPTGAYLTLTTCHPRYSARQRLIVHAVLDGPGVARADSPDGPPALTED